MHPKLHTKDSSMKPLISYSGVSICCMFVFTACAAVYTDASDANHVTFLNSSGESIEQLTNKAEAYCQQYGKTALFRSSDSQLVVVFDCKATR